MNYRNISNLNEGKDWKNTNKKYLEELQKFLDLADNIENEDLRKHIICQMLRCDKVLTEIAESIINKE